MRINILILLFASFLAFSCKKKGSETKSTTTPPNPALNSFTLKKDGVTYTPNYVLSNIVDDDAIGIETYMVYGQPENNTYGLVVRKSITPGTYSLVEGESEDFTILHYQDASTYFGWEEGTLTVLSNDTTAGILHCTFDVLLYNDDCDGNCPHITDGEMTVHY